MPLKYFELFLNRFLTRIKLFLFEIKLVNFSNLFKHGGIKGVDGRNGESINSRLESLRF